MVHAFAQILVAKLRDGHFSSDTRALGGDIFAQFGLGENLVRLLPRLLNGDLSIGADGDFTRRRVPSANPVHHDEGFRASRAHPASETG